MAADARSAADPWRTPDELRRHMGRRLRELRRLRGQKQAELADAAGVSHRHLAALEGEESGASVEVWWALARSLGVPIIELFAPLRGDGASMARDSATRAPSPAVRPASAAKRQAFVDALERLKDDEVDALILLARRVSLRGAVVERGPGRRTRR